MVTKKIIILSFILIHKVGFSQNLVKNGGFEDYTKRNVLLEYFGRDTVFPKNWYFSESFGTPDYYREYSIDERFSVPDNWYGHHPAEEGCSFIGLYPIARFGSTEHLLGELSESLIYGKKYYFSLWIKYAGNCCAYSVTRLEVLFVNSKEDLRTRRGFSYDLFTTENDQPQIVFTKDVLPTNDQWKCLSDSFIALDKYSYFIIGIFHQKENHKKVVNSCDKYRKNRKNIDAQITQNLILQKVDNPLLIINNQFRVKCKGVPIEAYYFFDNIQLKINSDSPPLGGIHNSKH